MKNLAQRFARAHAESVERDNRRQQVACCECGDACEYHPDFDPSPECTKCYGCAEEEARQQERERDEEASLEADWRRGMYSEEVVDGVRW